MGGLHSSPVFSSLILPDHDSLYPLFRSHHHIFNAFAKVRIFLLWCK